MVSFEGLNLSQMQSQFTELTRHVKEWSNLATRFDDFLNGQKRHTDVLERLVLDKPMTVASGGDQDQSLIEPRQVSVEQATKEIMKHFGRGDIFYYSDIVEKLNLDLATVVDACDRLKEEGHIEFDSKD